MQEGRKMRKLGKVKGDAALRLTTPDVCLCHILSRKEHHLGGAAQQRVHV